MRHNPTDPISLREMEFMRDHMALSPDPVFADIDLSLIPWSQASFYGHDHGMSVAKLAVTILGHEYPELNNEENVRFVYVAGLLHDLGREARPGAQDDHHEERSCKLAEKWVRDNSAIALIPRLRETVGRIVTVHHSRDNARLDPLVACVHDADCFDAARVEPGTDDGLKYLVGRTEQSELVTQWAKNRDNMKRWMAHRGW